MSISTILKQITDFKSKQIMKQENINQLEDSVIYYHEPFEAAISEEDWDILT